MFSPDQEQVRRFFCTAFAKHREDKPLEAIETMAALWMEEHPEYWADFADADAAVAKNYDAQNAEGSTTNPFLHLSMHLSISEQCSIDQPRGIRQAVELLVARRGDLHLAQHEVMECLGQMLWDAQQNHRAPDGEAYITAVQRRATRD